MLTRREERLIRSLHQRKHREEEGLFLVEGVRAVEDLLASGLTVQLALATSSLEDSERGRPLQAAIHGRGVPFREVGERELRDLAGTETPQGVLAVAEIPRSTLDAFPIERAPAVLLILDAVQDPGNLGTLARTAEALGAVGVVTLPGTVDPWNPKAVRAAMGSTFRLPIVGAGWEVLSPWLGERGFVTLTAMVGGDPVPAPVPRRCALVLGNEGAGVSERALAEASASVGIALRGRAESLNVAAAGAILLYELLR